MLMPGPGTGLPKIGSVRCLLLLLPPSPLLIHFFSCVSCGHVQEMEALAQAANRVADLSESAALDPITADAVAIHDALRDARECATAGKADATSAGATVVSFSSLSFPSPRCPFRSSVSPRCGCSLQSRRRRRRAVERGS